MKGLSFSGGEHSQGRLGTTASARSLRNLAATGATHVRLEPTWFQDSVSSALIYPMTTPGSPLDSTPDVALAEAVAKARELNLTVVLAPLVDLNWDLPATNSPLGAGSISHGRYSHFKCPPHSIGTCSITPAAYADTQQSPYILLGTCRWMWALNDSTAHV